MAATPTPDGTQGSLERMDDTCLAGALDAALDLLASDDTGAAAVAAGHRRLGQDDDW